MWWTDTRFACQRQGKKDTTAQECLNTCVLGKRNSRLVVFGTDGNNSCNVLTYCLILVSIWLVSPAVACWNHRAVVKGQSCLLSDLAYCLHKLVTIADAATDDGR